jgi:hypothetical protein
VKKIPLMALCNLAHSDLSSAFYLRINPCFTAGKQFGVEVVKELADTGKGPSSHS